MSEVDRICQQMKQALSGEAWHGPSLLEILEGMSAPQAAARSVPGCHSVWEIVLHLIGTQGVLLDRLNGRAKELTPEEDWPPVSEPTGDAWRRTVSLLEQNEERIRQAVEGFPDDRLNDPLIPGGTSAYNNFHGHVQHNLYHAGQMALVKKAASS